MITIRKCFPLCVHIPVADRTGGNAGGEGEVDACPGLAQYRLESDLTVKQAAHYELELSRPMSAFPIVQSVQCLEFADHTCFDERVEDTESG